jgi:hypothetical protein
LGGFYLDGCYLELVGVGIEGIVVVVYLSGVAGEMFVLAGCHSFSVGGNCLVAGGFWVGYEVE